MNAQSKCPDLSAQSFQPSPTREARGSAIVALVQLAGITTVLAGCIVAAAWWDTGDFRLVRPWISGQTVVFTPTHVDCGEVPAGTVLNRQVQIANLSSRPLILSGVQKSCSCIATNDFPITIPARQKHLLTLRIAVPLKPVPFQQSLKFFFDDNGSSFATVTLSAETK